MNPSNSIRLGLLLTLLFLITAPAFAGSPPQMPEHWSEGYVMANGIRIHYYRTGGDKPVLILAHGYSDDGLCWVPFALKLEDDFDIIMTDARGHGLSDPGTASDPADVQVEDLAGLINELGLEKPIIMGHSMGSSSAAWFAARYPDVSQAVILEDPRLVPKPAKQTMPEEIAAQQEKRFVETLARNNQSYDELFELCLTNSPNWERLECEYWAVSKMRYHPTTALIRWNDRPSINDLFAQITAPTLILKADAQGDLRQGNEEVAAILENGVLVHVEGAGHCVHRDQKEASMEIVEDFLARER